MNVLEKYWVESCQDTIRSKSKFRKRFNDAIQDRYFWAYHIVLWLFVLFQHQAIMDNIVYNIVYTF